MRTVGEWMTEYGESHRHPVNERLHCICVPLIVLSVLGLLWSLPVPDAFARISPWLNYATLVALGTVAYYFRLSARLAIAAALALAAMLATLSATTSAPWPLWKISLAVFAAGWSGQFIGHAIEGRRPSFFKDLQFLLIGPLWLVTNLFRRLRLRY
jgi:uncharacterized membrane protein YGL010W